MLMIRYLAGGRRKVSTEDEMRCQWRVLFCATKGGNKKGCLGLRERYHRTQRDSQALITTYQPMRPTPKFLTHHDKVFFRDHLAKGKNNACLVCMAPAKLRAPLEAKSGKAKKVDK